MMLRSKSSRSAYGDLGDKSNESVLSRTFSASKFCRGDNIGKSVDSHAVKTFGRISLDRNPSKSARFTDSQIQRALMVQEHMGQLEQELKWAKDRIFVVEEERKREAKRVPNMKVNESLPTKKVGELMTEIKSLKELVSNSKEELKIKDKDIESLKKELEQRDCLLNRMKDDMNKVKESEAFAMNQLLSSEQKIKELEDEVQRGKLSETKLLEQEKFEIEESRVKIESLNKKIESLETSIETQKNDDHFPGEIKSYEKDETEFLKRELRSALDAEENSKKAMDDLALVLKEVATEANEAKEKLLITESDLENSKSEAEQLKNMVRNTEDNYKKLLDETEIYRNTIERLQVEAEEALLAWNGKEMGFVDCIKRAEDENKRLNESLESVKNESYNLRDILKQAINEANAAKASAAIASDENSQLKDCLSEKDEALHFLTLENERLGIREATAYENIKEFKRLHSKSSRKIKSQDSIKSSSMIVDNHNELKNVKKTFKPKLYNDVDSDQENEHKDPEKIEVTKRESSVFTDDDETTNSDDIDLLEGHYDDSDSDRNQIRKKNMFRRVGDLMRRRRT